MNDREIVAYCRVSTQEQGINGLGMAAQRHAVLRFAAAFGCIVVATYEEVETARKDRLDNRPQLVKAVAHAKRSGALLVIVANGKQVSVHNNTGEFPRGTWRAIDITRARTQYRR